MALKTHEEDNLIAMILLAIVSQKPSKELLKDISKFLPESRFATLSKRYTETDDGSLMQAIADIAHGKFYWLKGRPYPDKFLEERLYRNEAHVSAISASLSELAWTISIKGAYDKIKSTRTIPIVLYLDDDNIKYGDAALSDVFEAIKDIGIERSSELPPEFGSWYKLAWGKTKDALSHEEVLARLEKLEHAATLKLIDKPQADVTHTDADSIAKLLKAIDKYSSACLMVGNVLIVKTTPKKSHPKVEIRTLTAAEIIAINRNKSILKSPSTVIQTLERECLRIEDDVTST